MFDVLEWLAAMCSHVPNKGEQMARYYGYYSNVTRGKRKNADADDKIPCILEPELTDKASRRNWAQLIQKIYEVDPLVCPKCSDAMLVIAFIEDPDVIKKILKHLGLRAMIRVSLLPVVGGKLDLKLVRVSIKQFFDQILVITLYIPR